MKNEKVEDASLTSGSCFALIVLRVILFSSLIFFKTTLLAPPFTGNLQGGLEGFGSCWMSLGASWEGLRANWEGLPARWEGLGSSWEGPNARWEAQGGGTDENGENLPMWLYWQQPYQKKTHWNRTNAMLCLFHNFRTDWAKKSKLLSFWSKFNPF